LYLSENSLTTLEELFLSPMIVQQKILLSTPIECAMMGNLFKVKLMQFSPPIIAISLDIRTSHVTGILKHMVTILSGLLKSKMELQQVWMLREVGDDPSPTWFDSKTHPYPIINLLIWNCRGALKPKFKKTLLDFVSWHSLAIFVISWTRIGGSKAQDIIHNLPFDGVFTFDPIGFAGGTWLLWRSDLVSIDIISFTEQEIHGLV
jgi:hypothetical protein